METDSLKLVNTRSIPLLEGIRPGVTLFRVPTGAEICCGVAVYCDSITKVTGTEVSNVLPVILIYQILGLV